MKSIQKENLFAFGKVMKSRLNYCKIKILYNYYEFDIIAKDLVYNFENKILKISSR